MKKSLAVILSVLLLLSLCACGKSAQSAVKTEAAYDYAAPAEAPAAPMPEPAAAEEGYGGFSADSNALTDSVAGAEADPGYDKIIYSASATVETTEFEDTLDKLGELVKQYGGFIQSSSVNGANYYNRSRGYESSRSAYYTIRVPSTVFSELMGKLSTLGNVPYSYTYTDNITAQYYDTDARLTAYKTQEARLLEMMELAETVEDVITIEEKLTDLRYRIESLQSTLNNWDRQVNYSTIDLGIEEVQEYTPEAVEKLGFGRQLWLALRDGCRGFVSLLKDAVLWLVAALPVLLVLAAAAVVVIVSLRRRAKKKAAKQTDAEK